VPGIQLSARPGKFVWNSNSLLSTQRNACRYPVVNPVVKQKMLVIDLGYNCGFSYVELTSGEAFS
jgi:hypothetical protein